MCGIVAAAACNNIVPIFIKGLKKLEYRGHDSAGLAVIAASSVEHVRSVGRVAELEAVSANSQSVTGISDTGSFAASDASALLQITRNMVYVENGDNELGYVCELG